MNMSAKYLAGKTAFVTGATSGIGQAIAEKLASLGANIIFNGFGNENTIDRIINEITTNHQVNVMYVEADLRVPAQIKSMIKWILEQDLHIDILVNNAGMQYVCEIENFPDEKWEEVIATNLSAPFYVTKYLIEHMREKTWGRIINIASVHGIVASKYKSAYIAAKHGLVGLTKVTALENATTGITCNAICPGYALTPKVAEYLENLAEQQNRSVEEVHLEMLSEKMPALQFITPQQIAEVAAFLCSDTANTMTGSTIPIDGGWLAQ